jgi:hypothetical protein
MKKSILIIFVFSIFTFAGFSQGCLPDGITFTSQQQIDEFQTNYPGCTIIEGGVEIFTNNITNLEGLSVLTAIEGNLEILATHIINLAGLNNITYVSGDLVIWENNLLTNFDSFENLNSISGSLHIKYNPLLINFQGLENTSFGGDILIQSNDALNSLAAFENLTVVGGGLFINNNNSLLSLSGLGNITHINGFLYVYYNSSLTGLSGLDNVSIISGGLGISHNPSLENLVGLENLSSLGEGLSIDGNISLSNLNGIQNLNSLGGFLVLDNNNILSDITGLDIVESGSITDLYIINNENLSTCEVQSICDYLVDPNGTIEIHDNAPGCNSETEIYNACWVKVDESKALDDKIQIFPNPAKNTITIHNSSNAKIKEVIIFSPSGKIILQMKDPVNSIEISKLQRGLYFIEVETELGNFRRKLIVE